MATSSPDASRLVAEPVPGDNALAVTVSELAGRLKRVVENEFGHVRLRGEISGWKRAASGHAYLALKDEGAVIDGVMWKGQVNGLAFQPQDGIEVVATGKLTTYPGRSKYQIVIERMELAGAGALMALLDKLRRKLADEGLFDAARKKPLPFMPRVIGVVTSPTGAVIRDILHRLEDRCPTHVLVWPVQVQGQGAAEDRERAGVAREQVLAQDVLEAQPPVEPPRPARRPGAVLGGRQQHVPVAHLREQGAQQRLAEPGALDVRAHVQLGELEVVVGPARGAAAGPTPQAAPDLLVPPLAGPARVAVGDAQQRAGGVDAAHRAPARPAHVFEPQRAALAGRARRVAHRRHVDVQGLAEPVGQVALVQLDQPGPRRRGGHGAAPRPGPADTGQRRRRPIAPSHHVAGRPARRTATGRPGRRLDARCPPGSTEPGSNMRSISASGGGRGKRPPPDGRLRPGPEGVYER